jgi:integrase
LRSTGSITTSPRQGDLMRLMLVTGCRIDEIGSLLLKDVQETGESSRITSGKTDNAARYVPVVEAAMSLLAQRYANANARQQDLPFHDRRLFPELPLKPATGKVYSASQWFTRYRRQALGADTDTRLTAHSFRHT